MAWFDANKNRGHKGGIQLGIGGGSLFGFSATSERYAATEEVVSYGGYPAMHGHGPARKERMYQDHGVVDNHVQPRHARPKKGQSNYVHRNNSPPSSDHYGKHYNYSSDDDDDVDEDDVICDENGYCYPKPKHIKEKGYEKEKQIGNGYGHGNRTVPHTTQYPKKDPYNEPSYPNDYKHKGNGYNPPTYTVPVTTVQPRNDPYYETPNISRPVVYNPPPPVKTRSPDHTNKKGVDYLGESTRNSPVSAGAQRSPFTSSPVSPFASSPRKETIDSAEAHRRYSRESGAQAEEIKYKGTIDCQEAARKYKGVFVDY